MFNMLPILVSFRTDKKILQLSDRSFHYGVYPGCPGVAGKFV